jgi:hypothetical protein
MVTLTDAQLGRIARAASDNLLDARDVGVIVDYANKGDLADAIRWVRCSPGLISVLREVAAEVERARATCLMRIYDGEHDEPCAEAAFPGHEALTRVANYVRWFASPWAARITITNEHHGVEWTWTREGT